jgi:hypothetical protein
VQPSQVIPRSFPALAPPADYPLHSPSRKRRGHDETPLVATALRGFVACEPQSIGDDPCRLWADTSEWRFKPVTWSYVRGESKAHLDAMERRWAMIANGFG